MTLKDLDKASELGSIHSGSEMGKLDLQEINLLKKHQVTSSTSIWSLLIKGILLELLKELVAIALKRARLLIEERGNR